MSSEDGTIKGRVSNPTLHKFLKYANENRLTTVGALWATTISGLIAYNFTSRLPIGLKIIHARVYAQAITLGALGVIMVGETVFPEYKSVKANVNRNY